MEINWNLWHGCHKKSEGCLNCYVYRRDEMIGKDASIVYKTKNFSLPIKKDRKGNYTYPSGTVFNTCFSSDFFLEEGDNWRKEALEIIKLRNDCEFFLITKRPERIEKCIDIEEYPNLNIACTMENNKRMKERLPIYCSLKLNKKTIVIEPMLEKIDLNQYDLKDIDCISVGGESGPNARTIDFNWVSDIHKYCKEKGIQFYFHQTGANIIVNNKLYQIPRNKQHSQAQKAFKD